MKIRLRRAGPPRLSTGSTLLNLALTGDPFAGFLAGHYYLVVGDSTSGKSFLGMSCFAEAAHNPAFDGYRLVYDNVEDGMLIDVRAMFGRRTAERVEILGDEGQRAASETIEEFYYSLDDLNKSGVPFIYVLDSMDALSSKSEGEKFEAQKTAHRKGGKEAGSYGDGKAKINAAGLRKVLAGMRKTGSILVIVCQTRDAIDALSFGPKKKRSGGHALRFYATAEFWSSLGGQVKKTINGTSRKIGDWIILKVQKNRVTGRLSEVWITLYPSYGIDDIGSCIDYLLSEKWWKKTKRINAAELGLRLQRGHLIRAVEDDPKKLTKLRLTVAACWKEVQRKCSLQRRPRYAS